MMLVKERTTKHSKLNLEFELDNQISGVRSCEVASSVSYLNEVVETYKLLIRFMVIRGGLGDRQGVAEFRVQGLHIDSVKHG